ncbi:hypothetical protein FND50_20930 [Rhodococcus sp. WB9]|nr:hypothetical protein FND50_20930 [Rhodococcus sp. WB9]
MRLADPSGTPKQIVTDPAAGVAAGTAGAAEAAGAVRAPRGRVTATAESAAAIRVDIFRVLGVVDE